MKTLTFLSLITFSATCFGQNEVILPVGEFNKIVASPRVNIILTKGDKESLRLLYNNVQKEAVNVKVKGKKLHIWLDHARVTEKQVRSESGKYGSRRGLYEGMSITAYITYKDLKSLEMRGEEQLVCDGVLRGDKLKLKAYGRTEIRLAEVNVRKFKSILYGENDLRVREGKVGRQVYGVFGENKIDTRGLTSEVAATRVMGEGVISLTALDRVKINALGEPTINVVGNPFISKGIVLGRAEINFNLR